MVIGAGLPDEFAGCGIQRVQVGNDVAEVGGGETLRTAFTQRDTGADLCSRGEGPAHATGFEIESVDSTVLAAHEYGTHRNRRLRACSG